MHYTSKLKKKVIKNDFTYDKIFLQKNLIS